MKYFISYAFDAGEGVKFSNVLINIPGGIQDIEDIKGVQDDIKNTIRIEYALNVNTVNIINWIEMK